MPHTIDETLVVVGLLVQQLVQICLYGLFVMVILYVLLYIIHHVHNLQIGSAMLPSLEG